MAFYSLLILGDQTKRLRDVMAAHPLYRCKHACMLKFHEVSPSLTKKIYVLHIARYNNKYDMISVMYRTFNCSLHISVLV